MGEVSLVVVGLLDLAIQYPLVKWSSNVTSQSSGDTDSKQLTATLARKALSTMIMTQPSIMISTLVKEVPAHLAYSHTTHTPVSHLQIGLSLPPSTEGMTISSHELLSAARPVDRVSHWQVYAEGDTATCGSVLMLTYWRRRRGLSIFFKVGKGI